MAHMYCRILCVMQSSYPKPKLQSIHLYRISYIWTCFVLEQFDLSFVKVRIPCVHKGMPAKILLVVDHNTLHTSLHI